MSQPRLLIVDSDEGARAALAALLRESGYAVREASTGVEGLREARDELPGLIIIDLWPFFSASLQMLERLRRSSATADIPVLVLTSAVAPKYQKRALAAGCHAYLCKPAAPERVLAEVRRVVGN